MLVPDAHKRAAFMLRVFWGPAPQIYAVWDCPKAEVQFDYTARGTDELPLTAGDLINITNRTLLVPHHPSMHTLPRLRVRSLFSPGLFEAEGTAEGIAEGTAESSVEGTVEGNSWHGNIPSPHPRPCPSRTPCVFAPTPSFLAALRCGDWVLH